MLSGYHTKAAAGGNSLFARPEAWWGWKRTRAERGTSAGTWTRVPEATAVRKGQVMETLVSLYGMNPAADDCEFAILPEGVTPDLSNTRR